MKAPVSPIHLYNIDEMNSYAGKQTFGNDFCIYHSSEIAKQEKMYQPSRSAHFFIGIKLSGKSTIKMNLIDYAISKNSLTIIPPGMVHQMVKDEEEGSGIFTSFTPAFIGANMVNKKHIGSFEFFSAQSTPHFLLTDNEADELCSLMLALKKIYANTQHPFKEEMMQHGFGLFMFQLAATAMNYRQKETPQLSRKEDLVIGFVKQLNTNFREQRSVQFYADALYITPKHLTKVVKEFTGKTCGEMIDEMVITEAKILLGDSSFSIAQVADLLSFSDQFFFSKFFKNHTGVNPSEYRKVF